MKPSQLALSDAAEWLGDWHPLAEQLGSSDGLAARGSISNHWKLRPVHNRATLRRFLWGDQEHILLGLELPAIQTAHGHAARNELRELVALDQKMAEQPALGAF